MANIKNVHRRNNTTSGARRAPAHSTGRSTNTSAPRTHTSAPSTNSSAPRANASGPRIRARRPAASRARARRTPAPPPFLSIPRSPTPPNAYVSTPPSMLTPSPPPDRNFSMSPPSGIEETLPGEVPIWVNGRVVGWNREDSTPSPEGGVLKVGPPTKVAWVGEDGSIDECELSSDVDLDVVEPLTEEMDGVNWDVTPESPWRYFQSTGMQLYEKKLDVIVAEENARLGKEWIEAIEERKMQKKMNEKKGYEEWEDWIEFDRDLQA